MVIRRTVWGRALFLLSATVLLSGCQLLQDPKTLLSEPNLPADKANLKAIINRQLPEGASMIGPRNDASKIHFTDLDNDGQGEAIVFYETTDKDVRIHGMIFKSIGGAWKKLFDFDGEGIQIDRVDLIDITGDKKLELVVGYNSNNTELNKGLIVYTLTDTGIKKLFEQPYSYYIIDDLDESGENRLYILNNRLQQGPILTVYEFQLDKMFKLHERILASATTSYTNMVSGLISKKRKGIVLDANDVDRNYYISNIISLNKERKLESLLADDSADKLMGKGNQIPSSKLNIPSADMNGDGIIEIPIPVMPPGWDLCEPYKIPYFTRFYQWDGKRGLRFIEEQYRDYMDRFDLKFPNCWFNRVTVDTKSNKNEMLHFVDIRTNETLAIVRFFSRESWEVHKKNWTHLSSYGDKTIGLSSKYPLKTNEGLPKIPELSKNDRSL